MLNQVIKHKSPCCQAAQIKQFPEDDFSRCEKCGKKYMSKGALQKAETQDEKIESLKKSHSNLVSWIVGTVIIVVLVVAYVVGSLHGEPQPNASPYQGCANQYQC